MLKKAKQILIAKGLYTKEKDELYIELKKDSFRFAKFLDIEYPFESKSGFEKSSENSIPSTKLELMRGVNVTTD